jgi:hypothetical protein
LWHGEGKTFGFAVAEQTPPAEQQAPPAESQQNAETAAPVADQPAEVTAPAETPIAPQTANTGEVKGKGKNKKGK